jgi:hypothetical protein
LWEFLKRDSTGGAKPAVTLNLNQISSLAIVNLRSTKGAEAIHRIFISRFDHWALLITCQVDKLLSRHT